MVYQSIEDKNAGDAGENARCQFEGERADGAPRPLLRCGLPEGHDGMHQAVTHIALTEPDPRCRGTLGSRPSWMSPDQYDPCRCRLDRGHDGPHWCEHLGSPDPREVDVIGSSVGSPDQTGDAK